MLVLAISYECSLRGEFKQIIYIIPYLIYVFQTFLQDAPRLRRSENRPHERRLLRHQFPGQRQQPYSGVRGRIALAIGVHWPEVIDGRGSQQLVI